MSIVRSPSNPLTPTLAHQDSFTGVNPSTNSNPHSKQRPPKSSHGHNSPYNSLRAHSNSGINASQIFHITTCGSPDPSPVKYPISIQVPSQQCNISPLHSIHSVKDIKPIMTQQDTKGMEDERKANCVEPVFHPEVYKTHKLCQTNWPSPHQKPTVSQLISKAFSQSQRIDELNRILIPKLLLPLYQVKECWLSKGNETTVPLGLVKNHFKVLSGSLPHLETLHMANCNLKEFQFSFLDLFQKLRSVTIQDCHSFSSRQLENIKSLEQLQVCVLKNYVNPNEISLGLPIIQNSSDTFDPCNKKVEGSAFKALSVDNGDFDSDDACERLSHIDTLKKLTINNCHKLSSKGIACLNKSHSLKELSLSGVDISDEIAQELCKLSDKLDSLNISDCTGISEKSRRNLCIAFSPKDKRKPKTLNYSYREYVNPFLLSEFVKGQLTNIFDNSIESAVLPDWLKEAMKEEGRKITTFSQALTGVRFSQSFFSHKLFDYFPSISSIELRNGILLGYCFQMMTLFKGLRTLSLTEVAPVGDNWQGYFNELCPQLEQLHLKNCSMTGAEIGEGLSHCKNLKVLTLEHAKLSESLFDSLGKYIQSKGKGEALLHDGKQVDFILNLIVDQPFPGEWLKSLPPSVYLNLRYENTRTIFDSIEHDLQTLSVTTTLDTNTTGQGLGIERVEKEKREDLNKLLSDKEIQLRTSSLNLQSCSITEETLKCVGQFQSLALLNLSGCKLTDDWLLHLLNKSPLANKGLSNTLQTLRVNCCEQLQGIHLPKILTVFPKLSNVELEKWNKISDETLQFLANFEPQRPFVCSLVGNKIPPKIVEKMKARGQCPFFRKAVFTLTDVRTSF